MSQVQPANVHEDESAQAEHVPSAQGGGSMHWPESQVQPAAMQAAWPTHDAQLPGAQLPGKTGAMHWPESQVQPAAMQAACVGQTKQLLLEQLANALGTIAAWPHLKANFLVPISCLPCEYGVS